MGKLLGYFVRGLVLLTPLGVTLWLCWWVFTRVDGLLKSRIEGLLNLTLPGAGFLATVLLITLVGFLGTNLITRSAVGLVERAMSRLPFVRLLYGSTKDLLNAFVGEKRRFDKPVVFTLIPEGAKLVGFVTQDSLDHLGLSEHVAVYCPHSYNFSGQLFVVPRTQVSPLDVASADAMAFVVSGGVSGLVPVALSTGANSTVIR